MGPTSSDTTCHTLKPGVGVDQEIINLLTCVSVHVLDPRLVGVVFDLTFCSSNFDIPDLRTRGAEIPSCHCYHGTTFSWSRAGRYLRGNGVLTDKFRMS